MESTCSGCSRQASRALPESARRRGRPPGRTSTGASRSQTLTTVSAHGGGCTGGEIAISHRATGAAGLGRTLVGPPQAQRAPTANCLRVPKGSRLDRRLLWTCFWCSVVYWPACLARSIPSYWLHGPASRPDANLDRMQADTQRPGIDFQALRSSAGLA